MSGIVQTAANLVGGAAGSAVAGPVAPIAGAVKTGLEIWSGFLTRDDRDEPDTTKAARIRDWGDAQRAGPEPAAVLLCKLIEAAGRPLTPGGDGQQSARELENSLGLAVIDLLYERELSARARAKMP